MLYDVKTPEEYFERLEDDWRREKVEALRALILEKGPQLKESINYKMLAYGDDKGVLFHLNAQKSYVSLYVGNADKVDPEGELLAGIDRGKGCLRFKKTKAIEDTRIDEFIARTVELWTQGEDVAC